MTMHSRHSGIDDLKHMEEGHVPAEGVYYGSIVAEPLIKEQLLSALAKVQSSGANMDALLGMDGYGFPDGKEGDAARKCAEALYSDGLLEKLNKDMMSVYTADVGSGDDALSMRVMNYEGMAGHGTELLPKVWPKPAVCVGYDIDGVEVFGPHTSYCTLSTYIDIDGDVFVCRCHTIYDGDDNVVLEVRELATDCDGLFLNSVEEFFPDEFQGFWDR